MLFTCDNGSKKGSGVNENEHTHWPPSVNMVSNKNFLAPCYYGLLLLRTPNRGPKGVWYNEVDFS